LIPKLKNNKVKMEKSQTSDTSSSSLFLTGTILLANMDYSGLMDYAIKAVVGGAIWMAYKIAGDFFSNKMGKKKDNAE
jgi:hypothetical protein